MKIKRRAFLKKSALGVGGILAGAQLETAETAPPAFHDPFALVQLGRTGLKFPRVCMVPLHA
jgi:hypothetical protein